MYEGDSEALVTELMTIAFDANRGAHTNKQSKDRQSERERKREIERET